jgi:putative redox protein
MSYTVHTRIGRDRYRMEVRTGASLPGAGPKVEKGAGNEALLLIADEPSEKGGTGQGFSPHQLLAASLGTCINATLRMYADRKAWPLEAVDTEVAITHGDSVDITDVQCTIRFTGSLDKAQRERLLQIAGRCPLHRTLMGTINIGTKLI